MSEGPEDHQCLIWLDSSPNTLSTCMYKFKDTPREALVQTSSRSMEWNDWVLLQDHFPGIGVHFYVVQPGERL